jgi:hypothetical protein
MFEFELSRKQLQDRIRVLEVEVGDRRNIDKDNPNISCWNLLKNIVC